MKKKQPVFLTREEMDLIKMLVSEEYSYMLGHTIIDESLKGKRLQKINRLGSVEKKLRLAKARIEHEFPRTLELSKNQCSILYSMCQDILEDEDLADHKIIKSIQNMAK